MQTRQMNTYFLFSKKGRGLGKIIGPIFEKEINAMRDRHFDGKKSYVIEESMFAQTYINQYYDHLQKNWLDKLYCYFIVNTWAGSVQISYDEKAIKSSWFMLFESEIHDNELDIELEAMLPGDPYLRLNFNVKANAFHIAKLKQDLLDMSLPFVKVGDNYYEDRVNKKIWTGSRAISKELASELIDHMCLS